MLYPYDAEFVKNLKKQDNYPNRKGGIFTASLEVETVADTYLELVGFERGFVFVNGHNLGRYWNSVGPQKRLYCPGVWLVAGINEVIVVESEVSKPGVVVGFTTPK